MQNNSAISLFHPLIYFVLIITSISIAYTTNLSETNDNDSINQHDYNGILSQLKNHPFDLDSIKNIDIPYMSVDSIVVQNSLPLSFNKRFIECIDSWVAYQLNNDLICNFGFVYFNEHTGLSLRSYGQFQILDSNLVFLLSKDSLIKTYRIPPNYWSVAIIPELFFNDLKIVSEPKWLKLYKKDTTSIEHLYLRGQLYNIWGECSKALPFLERARRKLRDNPELELEMAFTYNCLKKYDKAVTIMKEALKVYPNNGIFYKELAYAELLIGNYKKASKYSKRCIAKCTNKFINAETAYNMAVFAYINKDKKNFTNWYKKTKGLSENKSKRMHLLDQMKNKLK